MSEESILILNMLREGKITAEQADALLRAVRETAPPPPSAGPIPPVPPIPPIPPTPAGVDAETLAAMQRKLGDLQGKIGELQGKLGAAQAARVAGVAASIAGKVMDAIPKPEFDVNKIMDEAMKGLHSFKNDTMRSAKAAARQAAHEARRAARQSRHDFKFEFNWDGPGSERSRGRPANQGGQAEATDTTQQTISWSGVQRLVLVNAYGNVKAAGRPDLSGAAEASVTRTAWAGSEADARVLLQQVFLTHRIENGQCRVEVIAPADARNRLTVDYVIAVPQDIALEIETTFGEIEAEGTAPVLSASSASGDVRAARPIAGLTGDARVSSKSGDVTLQQWSSESGAVTAETNSGALRVEQVHSGRSVTLTSQSGDLILTGAHIGADLTLETLSGDLHATGIAGEGKAALKTHSGGLTVGDLRAAQVQVETVSGDGEVKDVNGVLTVKSISGDLHVKEVHSQSVSLNTVSGDASLSFAAPFSGSLAGTTVSGDLRVALWNNSNTRLEMNTISGDLNCALPLAEQSPDGKRRLSGTIGDPTGSVRLQSVSGDITVEGQN